MSIDRVHRVRTFCPLFPMAFLLLLICASPLAAAQTGTWGYSGHVGLLSGTVDGTNFAVGFTPERYLAPAFSVGADFLLSPTGDLTQLSGAMTARWHFLIQPLEVTPFIGFGLVYADYQVGSGTGRFSADDTSYVLPLGLSIERPFSENLALGGSFTVYLTGLDFGGRVGEDNSFTSLMFTLRFRP